MLLAGTVTAFTAANTSDDSVNSRAKKTWIQKRSNTRDSKIYANMRTSYKELSNYGLHSARGEKARDNKTAWSELRACTMAVPQLDWPSDYVMLWPVLDDCRMLVTAGMYRNVADSQY